MLGNHEYTIWLATDKAITKQLLAANGVSVPKGELLEKGIHERPCNIKVPLVVTGFCIESFLLCSRRGWSKMFS